MLAGIQFIVVSSIGLMLSGSFIYAGSSSAEIPASSLHPQRQSTVKAPKKAPKHKEGEVIVKFGKGMQMSQANTLVRSMGLNVSKEFKTLSRMKKKTYILIRSKSLSTEELITKLRSDPNVESVEPNYIYKPLEVPNDPKFGKLWGQHNTGQPINGRNGTKDADIDAPEAWDISTGSDAVVVAVIDTGVDYLHEDIAGNMWKNTNEIPDNGIDDDNNGYIDDAYGINAVNNSGDPMDILAEDGGHGTHVAGTIAAVGDNGKGVVGVSWNARIMALKFLSTGGGSTSDAIECLEYVIAQKNAGVNIVATNNSWGGGGYSPALKDAIQATNNLGILFTAAAGNGGEDRRGDNNDAYPHYPSSYDLPGVISVAATDQNDALASFSNYGVTSVDLSAPGTNILSTTPRVYIPKAGDIFFNNMESGMGNWSTGGTKNTWAISTDQEIFENASYSVPSPTHFLSDSPGVDYSSDIDSWIMLNNDIDLSAYGTGNHVYIGIGAGVYIEGDDYDHGTVEVSGDGGTTWTVLYDFSGYAHYWTNPYNFKLPDDVKTPYFRLRFHMKTDNTEQYDGWLIDNVGIGTELVSNYEYYNGTSMAAPQVSGAIAVLASVYTGDSIDDRKARILNTIDPLNSLNGKVATGGRLNLKSALDEGPVTCPEGEYFAQGTKNCIAGTEVSDPDPYPDKPCSGEAYTQGTNECISGTPVSDPDPYPPQPDCELIQGTNNCITDEPEPEPKPEL
ncbi:MAG: S8 family serine peptidase [Campylobacterota bacterium]|nr:S8 family serine peptidase [Campylobacterota bacterium]